MKTVICAQCGVAIGEIVTLSNGQEWLKIGPIVIRSMHGACECGQPFHWSLPEAMLSEMIASTLARRSRG